MRATRLGAQTAAGGPKKKVQSRRLATAGNDVDAVAVAVAVAAAAAAAAAIAAAVNCGRPADPRFEDLRKAQAIPAHAAAQTRRQSRDDKDHCG